MPETASTGVPSLDDALGGGIPHGACVLVNGEQGAGATEFAFTALAEASRLDAHRARFLTGLRAASRVEREARTVVKNAASIQVHDPPPHALASECRTALAEMGAGDLLVVENAALLLASVPPSHASAIVRDLADAAAAREVTLFVLTSPAAVDADVHSFLEDAADVVLSFKWHDGGSARRRLLFVPKVRGLTPALSAEQVPILEIALIPSHGVAVSHVKNVL